MALRLVEHTRANGYQVRFYSRANTYFDHHGCTYWTMGAPVERTTIAHGVERKTHTWRD